MDNNTRGAFVDLGNGMTAFVDGIPDKCEHDWNGDTVFTAASGKIIYWHTYRQWAHLPSDARSLLVQEHHFEIEDPIVEMAVSCSKCKKVYQPQIHDF